MALVQNKEDLAELLSEQLLLHTPLRRQLSCQGEHNSEIFKQILREDTTAGITHEEADTRIVLHCVHTNTDQVVVSSRDTDVLILLVTRFAYMQCNRLWMKSGAKVPTYLRYT